MVYTGIENPDDEFLHDPEISARLIELGGIRELLNGCIVQTQYRIPDSWVDAIVLTPLGERIRESLRNRNRRMRANEAKFAVFLTLGSAEGFFVDAEKTDLFGMRRILGEEILARRIHYPWILRRDLHDYGVEHFSELVMLDERRTIELMRALPIGVYQVASTVVGPLGALESREPRNLQPRLSVPGYYCDDPLCLSIHSIRLTTGHAAIRSARGKVSDVLEQEFPGVSNDFSARVAREFGVRTGAYSLKYGSNLFDVLGDSLTDTELQCVARLVVIGRFKSDGGPNDLTKQLGQIIGDPQAFVETLDRASLLQVLLLHESQLICSAVDEAVRSELIKIPAFEERVSRLSRWNRGVNQLRAVVGPRGLKFTGSSSFVARRAMDLLDHVYELNGALNSEELRYRLGAEAASTSDLLTFAIQRLAPEEIVERLLLADMKSANRTAAYFDVPLHVASDRDEFGLLLLWKLGFSTADAFTDFSRLKQKLVALENVATHGKDRLQEAIAPAFSSLEDVMQQALIFTTWALTTDHLMADLPFSFDGNSGTEMLRIIDETNPTEDSSMRISYGKGTMVPLAAGFTRLASTLQKISSVIRPLEEIPIEARVNDRPLAFRFHLPFHNLTVESQQTVLSELRELTRLFQDETVLLVRNFLHHGNNPCPSAEEVSRACSTIWRAIQILEGSGYFPQEWTLLDSKTDSLGRMTMRFERDSKQVVLQQPTWSVAPKMPANRERLIFLNSSEISGVGPMRFVRKRTTGDDPYWEGYPHRWRVRSIFDTAGPDSPESGDGFSLTETA